MNKHKWHYKINEPTEKHAICVKCGIEMFKSKISRKHTTRFVKNGETVADLHFGDQTPECQPITNP